MTNLLYIIASSPKAVSYITFAVYNPYWQKSFSYRNCQPNKQGLVDSSGYLASSVAD